MRSDEKIVEDPTDTDTEEDEPGIPEEEDSARHYGQRIQGPWVFGLCCHREDGILERRFFVVEDRKRSTLLPIIQNEVAIGSTIHSDLWKAYSSLSDHGFNHETVNHSEEFVNGITGAHTQTIECLWRHTKNKYKIKINGAKSLLDRQLKEEWWRGCNPSNTFNAFLRDMKIAFCE